MPPNRSIIRLKQARWEHIHWRVSGQRECLICCACEECESILLILQMRREDGCCWAVENECKWARTRVYQVYDFEGLIACSVVGEEENTSIRRWRMAALPQIMHEKALRRILRTFFLDNLQNRTDRWINKNRWFALYRTTINSLNRVNRRRCIKWWIKSEKRLFAYSFRLPDQATHRRGAQTVENAKKTDRIFCFMRDLWLWLWCGWLGLDPLPVQLFWRRTAARKLKNLRHLSVVVPGLKNDGSCD